MSKKIKRFTEAFTLGEISKEMISDKTSEFLFDRQKNGIDDFKLTALTVNPSNMTLTFKAEPTYIIGKPVQNVSTTGKEINAKTYVTQLKFLEPSKFLGSSSDFSQFSQREQKQLVQDYLKEGEVQAHCTCSAFYYQGSWEDLAKYDSNIYKFPGPKGTGKWSAIHGKEPHICKHIASVIDQIFLFDDEILQAIISQDFEGEATVKTEPTQPESKGADFVAKDVVSTRPETSPPVEAEPEVVEQEIEEEESDDQDIGEPEDLRDDEDLDEQEDTEDDQADETL